MEKNKESKEVKLNVSYLDFIKKIKESKLDISEINKVEIEKEYKKIVELKFNNVSRVYNRVLREENKDKLKVELEKRKINEKELIEIGDKIEVLSRESKMSKYI
jgi:hypothetical protein